MQRKRWRTEGTRVAFPQTSRVISSLTSVCLTSQPQTQYFHLNLRGQLNQLHHRGNYICAALIYGHLCADDIKALAWANCLVLHCNNSNTISDISPCGGIHNLLLCTVHMCTSWRWGLLHLNKCSKTFLMRPPDVNHQLPEFMSIFSPLR